MSRKTGFDINKITGSGTLILPVSMSRISAGQSPEECYQILDYFVDKLENFNNDAILLYTNGLYFNSEDVAFEKRVKSNNQIINHVSATRSLIVKNRKFIPKAIQYIPIDYVILNSPIYQDMFVLLKKEEQENSVFREFITIDMNGRDYTKANVNFILEEIVVGHLIREQLVDFPHVLAKDDEWRLICYPGKSLRSEIYVHKRRLLEMNKNSTNKYRGCMYNFKEKVLEVFDELLL